MLAHRALAATEALLCNGGDGIIIVYEYA